MGGRGEGKALASDLSISVQKPLLKIKVAPDLGW